ncbi:ribosomal protein S18-alanine N-acetyltransferase [Pseudidiomarina sp. E22-M8]|uniref:ribosomal protein S18-alanine N-acetyltransferase n=1 Tax=Pseudidiomarina sp. E22-M8 TaxID=3424768 RepID=UPI00403C6BE1
MIKRISAYQKQLYVIEQSSHQMPWSEGMLQGCFTDSYELYGWFSDAQSVQGFSILQRVCDEFTLMNIAVIPEYQGQGIGGQLLRHVQDLVARQQAKLWLEVRASNASALRLYERHGFDEIGRRLNYYPLGDKREDAIVMSWQTKVADD